MRLHLRLGAPSSGMAHSVSDFDRSVGNTTVRLDNPDLSVCVLRGATRCENMQCQERPA